MGLFIAANAQAGDYNEAMSKLQLCEMIAFTAQGSYMETQRGSEIPDYPYRNGSTPLMNYAKQYGKSAINEQDAYTHVWAKCMDNLDQLTLDYKTSGKIYEVLPR